MKNPNWKDFDFSKFDVVFHVAGIAHVSNKKSMEDLYFKINRDLAIKVAKKSKLHTQMDNSFAVRMNFIW